jgi:hypothetical protein
VPLPLLGWAPSAHPTSRAPSVNPGAPGARPLPGAPHAAPSCHIGCAPRAFLAAIPRPLAPTSAAPRQPPPTRRPLACSAPGVVGFAAVPAAQGRGRAPRRVVPTRAPLLGGASRLMHGQTLSALPPRPLRPPPPRAAVPRGMRGGRAVRPAAARCPRGARTRAGARGVEAAPHPATHPAQVANPLAPCPTQAHPLGAPPRAAARRARHAPLGAGKRARPRAPYPLAVLSFPPAVAPSAAARAWRREREGRARLRRRPFLRAPRLPLCWSERSVESCGATCKTACSIRHRPAYTRASSGRGRRRWAAAGSAGRRARRRRPLLMPRRGRGPNWSPSLGFPIARARSFTTPSPSLRARGRATPGAAPCARAPPQWIAP